MSTANNEIGEGPYNRSMRPFVACLFLTTAFMAPGQTAKELLDKAPPAIDNALRERVKLFYDAHVEGKFRRADEVVAEDSKDDFFEAQKKRYRGFEISRIGYEPDFTKAKVLCLIDTDMVIPPGGLMAVKVPMQTHWRMENGNWFWYVPAEMRNSSESPFGKMTSSPMVPGATPAPPSIAGVTVESVMQSIRLDRNRVDLGPSGTLEDTVEIANSMAGWIELQPQPLAVPGLTMSLDKKKLGGGEKARWTFRFDPSAAAGVVIANPVVAEILVQPTGRLLRVRLTLEVPAPKSANR